MISTTHDALVQLFRGRPELVAKLLRDALGVELPSFSVVRIESAELTETAPTEYRADLVAVVGDPEPELGIVGEIQLRPDADKRLVWPVYVTTLRARLRCPTCLVVITPHASVARWARQPIEIGPGLTMYPWVLGPDLIPAVVDPSVAEQQPELAVLSALAHCGGDDPERAAHVASAAAVACRQLDNQWALLYFDLIWSLLSKPARAVLENLMQQPEHREYQSEFARKYVAEGRQEGREEGRQEGREEGRAENAAEAVLTVLLARGIPVSDEERARIQGCKQLEQLKQWLLRAVSVESADELFG